MTAVLDFTPCPECRTPDPSAQLDRPLVGAVAGVATAAVGDGLVVAAVPAGVPSTPAGTAPTFPAAPAPKPPAAGHEQVTEPTPDAPSTQQVRTHAGVGSAIPRIAAWLWTRRGVLLALAAALALLSSCTDSDWGW